MVTRNRELLRSSELYRLKGELLLMQSASRGVSDAAVGRNAAVETQPRVAHWSC
jgi:hypothetical protein